MCKCNACIDATCDVSVAQGAPKGDASVVDTQEQVYISSLALLKVSEWPSTTYEYGNANL